MLGDLPHPLNKEHGQDGQSLPFGYGGNAPDLTAGGEQGLPFGAPSYQGGAGQSATGSDPSGKHAYTVATYDSRPPQGYDVIIDCLFQRVPGI